MPLTLPKGFKPIGELESPPRLVTSLVGPGGSGKTCLALQAPAAERNGKHGVLFQNFDRKIETDLLSKFADRDIFVRDYRETYHNLLEESEQDRLKHMKQLLKEVIDDFEWGVAHCRSNVSDTGTAIWDIIQMSEFGRVEKVPPIKRTEANRIFKSLFNTVQDSDSNWIIIHEVKDEWANEKPTGRYKRAGFSAMEHVVQVEAWLRRDRCICQPMHDGPCQLFGDGTRTCACKLPCNRDGQFHLIPTLCKTNPEVEGADVTGSDITFANFATLVLPDTQPEDWA